MSFKHVYLQGNSPELRQSFHSNVALPFCITDKRIDYIAIDGEGLCCLYASRNTFEKEFPKTLDTSPSHFLPKYLAALKRAYIHDGRVAEIIQELIHMTATKKPEKDLAEGTVAELLDVLNHYRRAAGQAPATEKTFKSKKLLIEAIAKAEAEVKVPTPQQSENKKSKQTTAEKRLSGLADLKEKKAEEASLKREKKAAGKAVKSEPAAKPSKAKGKAPASSEKPSKSRSAAGEGRGKGIGAFCCDLLIKGKSLAEVVDLAQKEFGSKTSMSSVRWYQNKLRKEGKL